MNIAIIGSGAREHAIAWHLLQYHPPEKIYVFSKHNILPNSVQFDIADFAKVKEFCEKLNIELLIVGPEEYLANGIVDYFANSRIKIFGPNKIAAQLEASKVFAKKFMQKYGVATAEFNVFEDIDSAKVYLQLSKTETFVIKYDGLAFGKGVFVCNSKADGEQALAIIAERYGTKAQVLIETCLSGEELSLITVCGKNRNNLPAVQLLATARDYKRAYDGDNGPNTGGMGVVCPHPTWSKSLEQQIYQEIINPTLIGLQQENLNFYGFLYFGIMLTNDGPKLLEYNARFGDPEAQVILPALEEDLGLIITKALANNLTDKACKLKEQVFIDVALVSKGYPDTYDTEKLISGIDSLDKDTLLFYAAVTKKNNLPYSCGGRVLHIVASGDTIEQAKNKVYGECKKIHFSNIYYRKDIGNKLLLNKKRIAILISGNGTNMRAIVNSVISGNLKDLYEIVIVISNNPKAPGINIAKSLGILVKSIDAKAYTKAAFDEILIKILEPLNLDYIVLAGYNRILSSMVVDKYKKKIINIHPADTKLYRGLHGYEWALEQQMDNTMITVHYVDNGCDTGEIIDQASVCLKGLETLEEIQTAGLRVEHELYSRVLRNLSTKQNATICVE